MSTPLNAEQRRALAVLFRRNASLTRELAAAKALLMLCEREKLYPQGWQATLVKMQDAPACKGIAQELDTIASHLEQSADDIDLSQVLSRASKATFLN